MVVSAHQNVSIREHDGHSVRCDDAPRNWRIAAHAVMWWCGYDCDALEELTAALPDPVPGTLWQIGTPDGDVGPINGSAEFPVTGTWGDPTSWVWYSTFNYTISDDVDPINAPSAPGYIGTDNVATFVTSERPPTDTTQELNITFCLCNFYDAGELVLYYDRYGSETDTVRLDGEILATPSFSAPP